MPNLDLAAELWVLIYIHMPYACAYRQQVMVPFGGNQRFLVWGDRFEAMSFWFCRSTAARGRVIGVLVTGLVRYCRTCYVLETHVPADIMING